MTLIPSVGFAQDCLQWADRTPPGTTGPSPRYGHAMAYDSARAVTVLFGGYDGSSKGDTWEWDGTTWTLRSLTGPSPRRWHAMAYDSRRQVTVLLGGYYNNELWEWDGKAWTRRISGEWIGELSNHAMSYDSSRGVTVIAGGVYGCCSPNERTYLWDGETMRYGPSGPGRGYQVSPAMSYDSSRGTTVLFNGGVTWEYDGILWLWRQLAVSGAPPSRIGAEMAFDNVRNVSVLFGGYFYGGSDPFLGDTWEWDGNRWMQRAGAGPPPRRWHAMAYDSARDVTLLFGGFFYDGSYHYLDDTWEWANCALAPGLLIAPGGATDFGSVAVGATADRGFTLRNTSLNPIVGNASVLSPFSVVGGSSYNLAPGQTQAVTVRYSPTQPGNNIAYITFTGTGTQQRQLLGAAFTTPISASVVGTVVEDDATAAATAGQPIPGAFVSFAGVRTISGPEGTFSLPGIVPGTYALTVTVTSGGYLTVTLPDLTIPAGPAPPVLIKLPRRIAPCPPVPGQRNTPVLLVSGFGCSDPPWETTGPCNSDYCKFTCDQSTWAKVRDALSTAGFGADYIWDPNEPTPNAPCEPPTNPPANPPCPLAGDILRGTEGIQWNADRLKTYVTAKVKQFSEKQHCEPASIDIVASSMGGLITREFLTHRQLDIYDDPSRRLNLKVGKVIMIATPNAGTFVADYALDRFYRRWYIGFKCDGPLSDSSFQDLTTTNARAFHTSHDWPRNVKLYLLIGNNVPEWGCAKLHDGHDILESGAISAEERVSDGAVPEPSVLGVYWEHVGHDSEGEPTLIRGNFANRLPYEGVPKRMPIDHLWLKQDTAAVAWILEVLTGSQAGGVAQGRESPLDSTLTVAETTAPSNIVDDQGFVLAPGEGAHWVIPIDSTTTLRLLLSADDAMTSATVQDPDGTVVAPSEVNTDPWAQTYDIAAPTPGEWTVSFSLDPAAKASAGVSVFASGDGPVTLIPTTEDSILNSQNALVSCALYAPGEKPGAVVPITGATVLVDLALPDGTTTQLVLLDDGLHSDGLADDGTYAVVFTNTAQAGSYRLRYRADGTAGKLAFRRVALGTFGVSSAAARISGNLTDEPVDFDADGFADFLRVQFWVTAQQAGTYLASGLVVDETGGSSIAGSETALELPIGTSTVSVLFDCRKLTVPGTYGPFRLENLELFERRDDQIAWVDRYREAYALATARIEVPCPPFDGDCDGDRDLRDIAAFQRCFLPDVPPEAECERFDVDGVGGVGLEDYRAMSEILGDADRGGPREAPAP